MQGSTLPLTRPRPLLRFDAASGALRQRRYKARVLSGPDAPRELELTGTHRVGSHPDAELVLSDPTVSRHHLELEARPDGVRVTDLGSTNGTFLSGARIHELVVEQDLTLTVGKTAVLIHVEEDDLGAPPEAAAFGRLVGHSAAMRRMFGLLEKVAVSDSSLLLLGETGTGKELIAEAVHQASPRASGAFVVVDCGAVSPSLIESELFGHVKGAFTGAVQNRTGAFAEADGGTLFLDEIGELPVDLQPRLLRALEAGTVKRVGDDRPRKVNVRVIAATHRNLLAAVDAGTFRRDLYFRLNVVPVQVPALRERKEDIPVLTRAILKQLGRSEVSLSDDLVRRFAAYDWPGNVRELRNVIERALSGAELDPVPTGEARIATATPSAAADPMLADLPFKEAKERLVEGFTREYLETLFKRHNGNISQVARAAGIARNHVYNLVTRYGLKVDPAGE